MGFTSRVASTLIALTLLIGTGSVSATTIYTDEAAFLAAAGAVDMESFESLSAGTLSSVFVLPNFTVTGDMSLEVRDISVIPLDGIVGLNNFNQTTQDELSTEITWDLNGPTNAFGFWVLDWGNPGASGTNWVWTTDAGDNLVMDSRPQAILEWRFYGIVNETTAFTQVHLSDPGAIVVGGDGDGYVFDRVFTSVIPEPATMTLLSLGLTGFALRRRKIEA